MKDNQKIQLPGLALCYLVSIWYLLLSQRWGGYSRGGYEEKKAKKKKINLDYRKKNYTVNIIALSLATKMLLLLCPISDMGALVCGRVPGAAALCHCRSCNHTQGPGSVEEKNHCLFWKQKSEVHSVLCLKVQLFIRQCVIYIGFCKGQSSIQAALEVAFNINKIKCRACELKALGRKILETGTFTFTSIISASIQCSSPASLAKASVNTKLKKLHFHGIFGHLKLFELTNSVGLAVHGIWCQSIGIMTLRNV